MRSYKQQIKLCNLVCKCVHSLTFLVTFSNNSMMSSSFNNPSAFFVVFFLLVSKHDILCKIPLNPNEISEKSLPGKRVIFFIRRLKQKCVSEKPSCRVSPPVRARRSSRAHPPRRRNVSNIRNEATRAAYAIA